MRREQNKKWILINDVARPCPTKILILARTSVFYVSMSVNYENLASYIIVDGCASLIMDFSRAGITLRLTEGLGYVINKTFSDPKITSDAISGRGSSQFREKMPFGIIG